jgi:hypothetical protein
MNRPTRETVRQSFRLWLLVVSILAICGGCAGAPTTPREPEPLANAPVWVTRGCRVYWQDQQLDANVVCGIGTAGPDRNPLAARETAVARARSAIARSIEVTIESLVRLESGRNASDDGVLRSIVHQLTSTSLPACRVESTWTAGNGEIFALVSLRVAKLQESLRRNRKLSPVAREDLAQRAAVAFAAMNAALDAESHEADPGLELENEE